MGNEKDVTEKTLESYNEVFADIVNVLLFNGEQVIKEDELEKESERKHYKFENSIHEEERDVAMFPNYPALQENMMISERNSQNVLSITSQTVNCLIFFNNYLFVQLEQTSFLYYSYKKRGDGK